MALVKQTIDVPFGLGIDTKTDEKNVLPGKLVTLENAVFDKIGRVAKRPGLVSSTPSGITIPSGTIYSNENEIVVRQDEGMVLVSKSGVGVKKPFQPRVFTKLETDFIGGSFAPTVTVDASLDLAGRSVGMAVFVDSNAALNYAAFDFTTKKTVATASVGPGFLNARVLPRTGAGAGVFVVGAYFSTTSSLIITQSAQVNTSAGGFSFGASTTIAGVNAAGRWDWCYEPLSAKLFVTYLDTAGTTLTVTAYDAVFAATSITVAVAGVTSIGIGAAVGSGTVGLVWTTSAGIFFRSIASTSVTFATATITLLGTAGTYELSTIGGYFGSFVVHTQESMAPAATYNRRVLWGTVSLLGVGYSAAPVLGVGIASKLGGLTSTLATTYDTQLQRSLYLNSYQSGGANQDSVQGRTLYGRHGGLIQNHCIPNAQDVLVSTVTNENALDFFTAQLSKPESTATAVATTENYSPAWVQAQQPGAAAEGCRPYPVAQVNGRTLFGGGLLHRIVARGVETPGLLLYPEIVSVTPSGAGGSLVDGTYSTICTYEFADSDGNVCETGASPPVSAVVSGGGGAGSLSVIVQNYRVPMIAGQVYAVFYRTLAGGTTYYRERRVLIYGVINSTTQVLSASAAVLSVAAILYSQGEQENAQPDGPVALCADGDRVWCVPGSSRTRVLPSKPIAQGLGLAFFPDLYRQVASQGDFITCLVRHDERLLAFKPGNTYVSSGKGPDATGNNDDLSEFSELFNNIGADSPVCALRAPLGTYVKTASDIWFIGRDLQPTRIGADVESLCATQTLRSSMYLSTERQVRFLYGKESQATFELVYDDDALQWSYNTRVASTNALLPSMTYFNGSAYYLMPGTTAAYLKESPTVFTDNGVAYSLKVVTAWLKPAQVLQGYARIYAAMLLGDNLATNTLQVRVRYNYETTWAETHTISSANATSGGTAWQPEIRFLRQKCESFQLEISDVSPTGQAFNLSGLELTVGVKPKSNRLGAAKRF